MKLVKCGVSLALVVGFGLTACGGANGPADSTPGNSRGGDSSAGAASNSTAGASSLAGVSSVAGEGGSGGAVPGETGGQSGSGGALNAAGAGGHAANPNNPMICPTDAPTTNTNCSLSSQSHCDYMGLSCRCHGVMAGGNAGASAGGAAGSTGLVGGGRLWQCNAVPVCPAAKPNVGDPCMAPSTCQYPGMGGCVCGGGMKWECFGGNAGCPTKKPMNGAACAGTSACPYQGGGCLCTNDYWLCN